MKLLLDPYQADLALDLSEYLSSRDQCMLESPTGSGKTLITRTACALQRENFQRVLVLAPQHQIRDGWCPPVAVHFPICPGTKGHPPIEVTRWGIKMNHASERPLLEDWLHLRTEGPFGYASTHQGFARWVKDPTFLPQDLRGYLLVLDECHHLSHNNLIGEATREWLRRGGKVLYVTATPFRTSGALPLPDDLAVVSRTVEEHIAGGRFAPRNIVIRSQQLSYRADRVSQMAGDEMPLGALAESTDEVRQLWERDGCPKAVFVVPSRGAKKWAARLAASFEGKRIFAAVGASDAVRDGLRVLLGRERDAALNKRPSEVDAIIACRRFDEGTDWPWCSHLYVVGLPFTFLRVVQLLGRTLRYKGGSPSSSRRALMGYNPAHMDAGTLTFLMPTPLGDVQDAFRTRHGEQALLIAVFMADARTGFAYTKEMWKRGEAPRTAAQRRRGYRAKAEAARSLHLYAALVRAALVLGEEAPSDEALSALLRGRGFSQEEIDRAFLVRDLRFGVADPELPRGDLLQRIVPDPLQPVFDRTVTELGAANRLLFQQAKATSAIWSQFTGRELREVEACLYVRWRKIISDLGIIKRAIASYQKKHGECPATISGDASTYFGFSVTWAAVNNALQYHHQTTLYQLIRVVAGQPDVYATLRDIDYSDENMGDIARAYLAKKGVPPRPTTQEDASEWFGEGVTWLQVASAYKNRSGRTLRDLYGELGIVPMYVTNTQGRELKRKGVTFIGEKCLAFIKERGRWPRFKDDASPWFPEFEGYRWGQLIEGAGLLMGQVKARSGVQGALAGIIDESLPKLDPLPKVGDSSKAHTGIPATWKELFKLAGRKGQFGAACRAIEEKRRPAPAPARVLPELTLGMVESEVRAHTERHGTRPTASGAPASEVLVWGWSAVNSWLQKEHGLSLADLSRQLGCPGRRAVPSSQLKQCTSKDVLAALDRFVEVRGTSRLPGAEDPAGEFIGVFASWRAVRRQLERCGLNWRAELGRRGFQVVAPPKPYPFTKGLIGKALRAYMAEHDGEMPPKDEGMGAYLPPGPFVKWQAAYSWLVRRGSSFLKLLREQD